MGLAGYTARRSLEVIPVIFFVIILDFAIIHIAPGDPAMIMAGERVYPELVEAIRARYGLDKPLYEQLAIYLTNILKGDLGYSFTFNRPVISLIAEKIPATMLLVGTGQICAIILGILLGTYAARKRGSLIDIALSSSSLALFSMPVFWLGLILMMVFAINLRWLPTSGIISVGESNIGMAFLLDIIKHLFLPLVTITAYYMPMYLHLVRSSVEEVMREDFMITARAKGLDTRTIFYKHALRNALLPTITMAGLMLGFALTGAILTETVYGWPGMGRLLYDAIFMRDYPLLMGILVVVSVVVTLAGLITDIVYAFLDPRVTYK